MSVAWRTGWPAVAACFALALFSWSFGFYGQAVFLAGLQRQTGWSASLITAATTCYYLLGAVGLAFVPDALARFGPRRAVLGGMVLLAASAALLPHVGSVPAMFAVSVVMAAGWAMTSGTAISGVLAPWFGRRRGLAISLALNGASAAGFTIVPLMIKAVAAYGFAAGVGWTAAILFACIAPVVALLLRPPSEAWLAAERARPGPTGAAAGPDRRPAPATRRAVLASRRFWLLSLPFGLGLVAQVGFVVHQVAFLLPRLGPDGTGVAVALTTVAALTGRIAVATFVDRADRRVVTAASFGLQAAALGAMLADPSTAVLYAGSFVFGLSVGNAITLPALLVLDEFAPAAFGLVLGLVTASNQLLYAFGPVLLGFLRDASAGYGVPLMTCMGLEIAAAILAIAGRPGP